MSIGLDSTVLRAMQIVVERALIPDPADLDSLRLSAEEVLTQELQADPRKFFAFLEDDPRPTRVSSRFRRTLEGGAVRRFGVRADYTPYGFDHDASPSGQPIRIERWMHENPPGRGTILTIHGFTMGNPRIDAYAMFANDWYRHGLDVALLTLPYHSARKPSDSYFSGDRFAVPHVSRMAEAVREAIFEIRLVTRWLQEETQRPVGILGLSLGGYLSSLLAGLCDDPDFVIPMVPPVCIGDLAWRFFTQSRHYDKGVLPAFTKHELRSAYRIHSPLTYPLRVPRHRTLIIAGRGDRIVPPEHPHALWEHWGNPEIHWFSGSHLAPFGRQRIVNTIVEHLERLEIL
jgi:pimeloyl-ACP methyl ester carboxylesterase